MPASLLRPTRDPIRYGFAVGRVRVLETHLLGMATYERLLDAASFSEQLRILSDTMYGRYLEGATTTVDVEVRLDNALDDFYRFLDESNLPRAVVSFFRARYDFANLKAALKARILLVPREGMLSRLGTVAVDEYSGPLEDLPDPLGSVATELLADIGDEARSDSMADRDLLELDTAVDRAMFAALSEHAADSRSEFLKGLTALMIDIANVKTLLRARQADVPALRARGLFFEGGSIAMTELWRLYALSPLEAGIRLAGIPALRGLPAAELADPNQLDVLADNLVVRFLRRARMVPIGPEPVIAYVMAREAEVVTIRTLLLGRLSGLPAEDLRRRIREMGF